MSELKVSLDGESMLAVLRSLALVVCMWVHCLATIRTEGASSFKALTLTPRDGWVNTNSEGQVTGGFHVDLLDELAYRGGFTWRDSFALAPNPDTKVEPKPLILILISDP